MLTRETLIAALDAHAPWSPVGIVPGLFAWQAEDELALWQTLERATGGPLPPPFFCVAWPGAHLLAWAMLTGLVDVGGKHVADVGAGSGLASAAAGKAGARSVLALDRDPLASWAAVELGRRHDVTIDVGQADALLDPTVLDASEVILGGDLVYTADQVPLLRRAIPLWRQHATVVLADSGRPHFDACGLPLVAERHIEVAPGVDGVAARTVRLYLGEPQP